LILFWLLFCLHLHHFCHCPFSCHPFLLRNHLQQYLFFIDLNYLTMDLFSFCPSSLCYYVHVNRNRSMDFQNVSLDHTLEQYFPRQIPIQFFCSISCFHCNRCSYCKYSNKSYICNCYPRSYKSCSEDLLCHHIYNLSFLNQVMLDTHLPILSCHQHRQKMKLNYLNFHFYMLRELYP